MSSNVFFISDTHFGHKRILEFQPQERPFDSIEEHDEELIRRWNAVVTKRDVVYHLGDVLLSKQAFDTILPRLNGTKKLIQGNHDIGSPIERYQQYFTKIVPYWVFDEVFLSHVPVHPQQKYRFKANMHGHLHSNIIDDSWYINMCVERWNLTPVAWETVSKLIPSQS